MEPADTGLPPEPKKLGRPTKYTPELGSEIFFRMAMNATSLRRVCQEDDMPSMGTVCRWLLEYPDFRDKYDAARDLRADILHEDLIDIADDTSNDKYIDDKGNERVDWEVVNRSKLRIDTRKWILARMNPKKYGDTQRAELDVDTTIKIVGGLPE